MKTGLALICSLFLIFPHATPAHAGPPAGDDLSQGLWWLYHLRYDKAVELYDRHIAAQPEDPAGYFYKAATDWWHLAQEFEYEMPEIQKRFDESVQLAIQKSQARLKQLDEDKPEHKKEAALIYLYWGGAEGLKGRWLVTQKHWVKAYFAGRNGHNLLKKSVKLDPEMYDAYMGLGIYDYFSDTLSGFVGAISAIFVRGDRHRGIKQLELAIEKGSRARVEAMIFLCEIFTFEEKQPERAIPLTKKLKAEFPNSPMATLAEIMAHYQANQWDAVTEQAQDYLERSEIEVPEFTHKGVYPALYCLGIAKLWGKNAPAAALPYFERIIKENKTDDPNRWLSFAHLRRAQVYDLQGKREEALKDYQTVLSRRDMWGTHRQAREGIKKPYTK